MVATNHWEIKGRFRKRVVLANVPSFQFSFRGNMRTYPRSGICSGGTSECTLVPVFVPGEHPPKSPFWKRRFPQPQNFQRLSEILRIRFLGPNSQESAQKCSEVLRNVPPLSVTPLPLSKKGGSRKGGHSHIVASTFSLRSAGPATAINPRTK